VGAIFDDGELALGLIKQIPHLSKKIIGCLYITPIGGCCHFIKFIHLITPWRSR
jgi:hypothetical protein